MANSMKMSAQRANKPWSFSAAKVAAVAPAKVNDPVPVAKAVGPDREDVPAKVDAPVKAVIGPTSVADAR